MTVRRPSLRVLGPVALAAGALLLALAGCAGTSNEAASTPTPTASTAGPCTRVTVVVDYGSLKEPSLHACAPAGLAAAALASAKITTEGTTDYGNQVVCRVDGHPTAAQESCATLPKDAYWALWVKTGADGKWEYAQDGIQTLKLADGDSLGLVYTTGNDSTPPQD